MKALAVNEKEVVFIDVRTEPQDRDFYNSAFAAVGEDLVNRRSTTWRNLSDQERVRPPVDLLLENPSLMKRPLIVNEGAFHLGWTDQVRTSLIG